MLGAQYEAVEGLESGPRASWCGPCWEGEKNHNRRLSEMEGTGMNVLEARYQITANRVHLVS